MATALLLLDYQAGICRPEGAIGSSTGLAAEVERREILAKAASCLDDARSAGVPVVHSYVAFDADYAVRTNRSAAFAQYDQAGLLQDGSSDAAICEEVAPRAGEPVLRRSWVDPFVGTPLAGVLTARGISSLFLGGVATNFVVESAARHAGDLGFNVCVLEDLCASFSDEMHEFAIENVLPVFAEVAGSDSFRKRVRGEVPDASA